MSESVLVLKGRRSEKSCSIFRLNSLLFFQPLLPRVLHCFSSIFPYVLCYFVKRYRVQIFYQKFQKKKQIHKERCPSLHPFSLFSSSIFCNLVLLLYMKWIMPYYHKNKREPFRCTDVSKLPSTLFFLS